MNKVISLNKSLKSQESAKEFFQHLSEKVPLSFFLFGRISIKPTFLGLSSFKLQAASNDLAQKKFEQVLPSSLADKLQAIHRTLPLKFFVSCPDIITDDSYQLYLAKISSTDLAIFLCRNSFSALSHSQENFLRLNLNMNPWLFNQYD